MRQPNTLCTNAHKGVKMLSVLKNASRFTIVQLRPVLKHQLCVPCKCGSRTSRKLTFIIQELNARCANYDHALQLGLAHNQRVLLCYKLLLTLTVKCVDQLLVKRVVRPTANCCYWQFQRQCTLKRRFQQGGHTLEVNSYKKKKKKKEKKKRMSNGR